MLRFPACVFGAVSLVAFLAGCGDRDEPRGLSDTKRPTLLPAAQEGVRIVIEAESGVVEPDMVVEEFEPVRHPDSGLQEASGGKCVAVPKDANLSAKAKQEEPKGRVTLKFTVPKAGVYYIYPRVWWTDGCSKSIKMALDGSKPLVVMDTPYQAWHWAKLASEEDVMAPRGFRMAAGEHSLVFSNRHDDVRLDQVYVTDDPEDRPAGIEAASK